MAFKITVYLKDILEKAPCSSGLALFKSTYGEVAELEMTVENIVKICTGPFKHFYIWAAHNRLVPWYNLSYADLRSANLEDANLRSANLRSANLRSANLEGAWYNEDTRFPNGLDLSKMRKA